MKKRLLSSMICALLLSGCGESDDPSALVKAVKLEKQRENGTLIESIAFEGNDVRLREKQTHQLTAMGTNTKGEVLDVTKDVTWSSSDDAIATIDKNGLVTAVKASDENQGKVTFTATTINDVVATTELSVSDVAAQSLEVVQFDTDSNDVVTCLDSQLAAKVTYQDGFVSAPDTNRLTWTLAGSDSANVDSKGILHTSSADDETVTVTATHSDGVSSESDFNVSNQQLNTITTYLGEDKVDELALSLAERKTLATQLTLLNGKSYQIDSNTTWSSTIDSVVAVSNNADTKGNLVALTEGVTTLTATCGGKSATVSSVVTGDSTLESLKLNSGVDKITVTRGKTVDVILYADLKGLTTNLNVSEFAIWNLSGTDLATAGLDLIGTDKAKLVITASSSDTGSFTLISSYQGKTTTVDIEVI